MSHAKTVAASFVLLALASAPATSAGGTTWRKYGDTRYHISVSIPSNWRLIPHTVAGVEALAAKSRKAGQQGLADQYEAYIRTSDDRSALANYYFLALLPSRAPVPTDFAMSVAQTSREATAKDLRTILRTIEGSLRREGMTPLSGSLVTLPSGEAVRLEAQFGGTARDVIYVIPHANHLFKLTFRAPLGNTAAAPLFDSIVRHFVAE